MQAVTSPIQDYAQGERAIHPARHLLDEYAAGQIAAAELGRRLVALCDGNADAGCEALSWLDQYHRRGVVETSQFRALTLQIERLVVPGPATTEIEASASAPMALAAATTGGPDDGAEPVLLVEESQPTPAAATPHSPAASTGPQASAGPCSLGVGTVLRERYEILSELGRGGMGTVYRVRDRHRLGLELVSDCVALKVLREDWVARPEALAALRHECFRAQALSHPGIVNVFDFDRDADVCFVTMELVEGRLLSKVLERIRPRRLARAHALALLEAVGSALQYAHSCGVVHADLKPGNVMIGHDGQVRVLDFGLARPVLREPFVDDGESGRALRAATPGYASPDVLRGGMPTVRDDVFSFGCLAYELLGGEPAFPRWSRDETRGGRETPPRPRGLRRREWQLIRKALVPERERRLASVQQLRDGLLRGELTPLAPLKALLDQATTGGREWLRVSLGIAAACLFIVIAVLLVRAFTVAPGPPAAIETASAPAAAETDVVEPVTPVQTAPANLPASEATPSLATAAATSTPEPPPDAVPDAPAPKTLETTPEAVAEARVEKPAPAPIVGPGRISLTADRYTVGEGGSVAKITLTRTGSVRDEAAVRWWTEPGEAMSDQDYADFGSKVEYFAAGEASRVIYVPIVSDSVHEWLETFTLHIRSESSGVEIGRDRATIVIVDDD